MFANEETALTIRETMLNASLLLERSTAKAPTVDNCSESELANYKTVIKHILAKIKNDVLEEIYRVHPSLEPPSQNDAL